MNIILEKAHAGVQEKPSAIENLCSLFSRKEFCVIPAEKMRALLLAESAQALDDVDAFLASWNDLCLDTYMADGGTYRYRRHATLSALPSSRTFYVEPHQPHYQSLNYNNLNGGIARHYEPIKPEIMRGQLMDTVLRFACSVFGSMLPYAPWHIEVHQFRIDASKVAEGKPTPEGIHRDGVNFVLMMMIKRSNVVNGSTQIFDRDQRRLDSFALTDIFDTAIVNDEHVLHGVTPIVQLDTDKQAYRDVLVVTFKKKIN
jgi:hypothetical protein